MKTKNGFTLFEVMLVMVFSIALTALGIISLDRVQKVFSLRSSADEIRSQIRYGRELAIANKGNAVYSVAYSSRSFRLLADGKELNRYELPAGISLNPNSFVWTYTPVTGELSSCSPCQLTLSLGSNFEIINVSANGIVD